MVEWRISPNGPTVVHPAPCGECFCWCGKDCGCNGKTCKCEICDMLHNDGWDYQPEQKERLISCDCSICKKAKPGAAKRFSSLVS